MPTVHLDLDPSPFSSAYGDESWTRRFRVEDLVATDVPSAILEALSEGPVLGDAVPAPLSGMFVSSKIVERVWCPGALAWQAIGVLTYTRPTSSSTLPPPVDNNGPGFTTQVQTLVETVETAEDRGGTPISVLDSDGESRGRRVQVMRPRSTFTFTRKEVDNPRARSDLHVGTINSALWNGYAAETVFCAGIDSETIDGNETFDVVYTFQYASDGWAVRVVGDDLTTGRPIAAPGPGESATFDVYPTTNFSLLNITLS